MFRTRVKICGITRIEDAINAVDAGADALGFVFYSKSPRFIDPNRAAEIIRNLPPFVTTTGLFVDHKETEVNDIVSISGVQLMQFHGQETPAFCEQFGMPYIKAVRVRDETTVEWAFNEFSSARGILADAYVEGVPGGTGQTFDWGWLPAGRKNRVILAGGLTAQNVAEAVQRCSPYAVDVSGGVELSKGIKDKIAMQAFVKEVQSAKKDH